MAPAPGSSGLGLLITQMQDCGSRLGAPQDVTAQVVRYSIYKHREYLEWLMAVIHVESLFRPELISNAGAHGLTQMTRIAVDEAETQCRLPEVHDIREMLRPATGIRYGSCYLRYLLELRNGNWREALILYNGGGRQLARYLAGKPLAAETANYIVMVERARDRCVDRGSPSK